MVPVDHLPEEAIIGDFDQGMDDDFGWEMGQGGAGAEGGGAGAEGGGAGAEGGGAGAEGGGAGAGGCGAGAGGGGAGAGVCGAGGGGDGAGTGGGGAGAGVCGAGAGGGGAGTGGGGAGAGTGGGGAGAGAGGGGVGAGTGGGGVTARTGGGGAGGGGTGAGGGGAGAEGGGTGAEGGGAGAEGGGAEHVVQVGIGIGPYEGYLPAHPDPEVPEAFLCPACPVGYLTLDQVKQHYDDSHYHMMCPNCYSMIEMTSDHLDPIRPLPMFNTIMFECNLCSVVFGSIPLYNEIVGFPALSDDEETFLVYAHSTLVDPEPDYHLLGEWPHPHPIPQYQPPMLNQHIVSAQLPQTSDGETETDSTDSYDFQSEGSESDVEDDFLDLFNYL